MPETLGVSKTLKVPGDRHCSQDAGTLQKTHELLVRKLLIHPNGPALDLPSDEIKKDGNCLSESPPDLTIPIKLLFFSSILFFNSLLLPR